MVEDEGKFINILDDFAMRRRILGLPLTQKVIALLGQLNDQALGGNGKVGWSLGMDRGPDKARLALEWEGRTTKSREVEIELGEATIKARVLPFHLGIETPMHPENDWLHFLVTANYEGGENVDEEIGRTGQLKIEELEQILFSQVNRVRESLSK